MINIMNPLATMCKGNSDISKGNGELGSFRIGREGSGIYKQSEIISPIPLSRSNMKRSSVPLDDICSTDAYGLRLLELPVSSHYTAQVNHAANADEGGARKSIACTQTQGVESKRSRKEADSDQAHNSNSEDEFKLYIKGRLNF